MYTQIYASIYLSIYLSTYVKGVPSRHGRRAWPSIAPQSTGCTLSPPAPRVYVSPLFPGFAPAMGPESTPHGTNPGSE